MKKDNRTTHIEADRSQAARIGAHSMHALYDARETTKAGRAAFMARFLTQVDPDNALSELERNRRAGSAKKAYFARLALKSAKARRRGNS